MLAHNVIFIYSNDGTTVLETVAAAQGSITVQETGFSAALGSYEYGGDKKFLGFATSANATEPTYAIGDTFTVSSDTTLYIVESEVTDLTNTTWYVPSGWQAKHAYGTFAINYSVLYDSQSLEGSLLRIGFDTGSGDDGTNCISFYGHYIYNDTAFTISITDGDDATNTSLISWLETYGTQLKVTDLTNTTWYIPAGWEAEAGYGIFTIRGSGLRIDENLMHPITTFNVIAIGYSQDSNFSNTITFAPHALLEDGSYYANNYGFELYFTSGTDTTNPKLIAWLSQYGELQEEDKPTSDTKPVYLRKNGAWVKQDAYERQNGEWVQISRADKISIRLEGALISPPDEITQSYVKFNSPPESSSNYDYWVSRDNGHIYNKDGEMVGPLNLTISPVVYIWGTGRYKINDGLLFYAKSYDDGTTVVTLNNGDVLTLVASDH
jgi:hypothetical protein